MKKIVALLLSVLMLCSSIATYEGVQETASGFFIDGGEEKQDKDIKEDKKELKEFVSQGTRKLHLFIHSATFRRPVEFNSLPSPIIDKQTPPPDTAC